MKYKYHITGMTCSGCTAAVQGKLAKVIGVENVIVDLQRAEAEIEAQEALSLSELRKALPDKYRIDVKKGNVTDSVHEVADQKSKWVQLRPLFLIFTYLFVAVFLLNYQDWNSNAAMLDFMGLFYIVFSFFKFLDLKGFPESFRMYDPLAKAIPLYAWAYPFLELALGLLFLMRFQIGIALVVTVVILGTTTFGVLRTLLDKKQIRCACLGTALQLPMTEATFIENTIMLAMATVMLA